jgi:hypothetical protein
MVNILVGKTLSAVNVGKDNEYMEFVTVDGEKYYSYHYPDCCESVEIVDIIGDLSDLIGNPLLISEERNSNGYDKQIDREYDEEYLWTFYEFATIKGSVTVRWLGQSNGYYSVSVSFIDEKEFNDVYRRY